MTKALIVSPYLDHLGGGERYMLSVASVLESLGYQIYFAWDNLSQISSLATMLGITLVSPQLDAQVKNLYFQGKAMAMYRATSQYDVVVYLSDGSIPLLGGKRNILHMQVPFHGIGGKSWKNKLKSRFIHAVVVNSSFTKTVIDQEYDISSQVVYPPVMAIKGVAQKEKIILSVGRFEPSLNTKHQDKLIEAFKLLSPKIPGWKLVLAGGSSSDEWLNQLKAMSNGFSIEFMPNVDHVLLTKLYQQATIYWHAAGYGVDERKNPELTEHFGISTVEAISAACLPLVVPYGGQKEIISDSRYHWTTIEELCQKTLSLITHPTTPEFEFEAYSLANFKTQLEKIIR